MKIIIAEHEFTEVWDGVLYKKLSRFPRISDWELRTIVEFVRYEKRHGRDCTIECAAPSVLDAVNDALSRSERFLRVPPPPLITECTACLHRGCVTRFVCHTSSVQNAKSILQGGSLLSAVRSRGIPAAELAQEARNAAHDPPDWFDYVMFAWGNCQAGDRLVMERRLGRTPTESDLRPPHFTPGVRFYFEYETLRRHPAAIHDGVLPLKVKDEVRLSDWVHAIVIPEHERTELESLVPQNLRGRVLYIANDTADIWAWTQKVYAAVRDATPAARNDARPASRTATTLKR